MRTITELKENWNYVKSAESAAQAETAEGTAVTLPHTWNAVDGQDGGNDYYRGTCWYVRRIKKPEMKDGRPCICGVSWSGNDGRGILEWQKTGTP